ncbi:hypothetical protein [Ensifer sp. Root142]|nr:hypothetical protein [Ensifer sp. Root142]
MTTFVASILLSLSFSAGLSQAKGGDPVQAPVVLAKTGTGVVYGA